MLSLLSYCVFVYVAEHISYSFFLLKSCVCVFIFINMERIFDLPGTQMDAISFSQKWWLLFSKQLSNNGSDTKLHVTIHEIIWRCIVKNQKSLSVGNSFTASRIPFLTALRSIYCLVEELTSIKCCKKQLNMGEKATVD